MTSASAVTSASPYCSGNSIGRRGAIVRRRNLRHMGRLVPMQEALGIVIFIVVIVAAILAVASLAGRDELYDQIGRGGLSIRDDPAPRPAPQAGSPAARAEQEEEGRQMVQARSARLVRQGKEALDVDAEVARTLRPTA